MKRIAYSFLLIFFGAQFISCSNNYLSGGNEISIRKIDGSNYNYKLLSVRDSSLIVIDAKDDALLENSYSHAQIIVFDSIYQIYREPYHLIKNETVGRVIAGAVGAGLGAGSYFILTRKNRSQGLGMASDFGLDIIGVTIGFFGVAIIFKALFPSFPFNNLIIRTVPNKELHPKIEEDKEFLTKISLYPNAEPEMLKLVH